MDEHWREPPAGSPECPISQVNERKMRLGLEFTPRFAYDPAKTRQAIQAVRDAEVEAGEARELEIRRVADAELALRKLEEAEDQAA